MKKKKTKKIVVGTLCTVLFLFIVLAVHIYVMMKPGKPDQNTISMTRIDFKQPITHTDATKISQWLYSQKGVTHVSCNEKNSIALFTYYPVKANANNIVTNLKNNLHYNAVRFVPSAKDVAAGCPMANSSFTYKIYNTISKVL